MTAPRPRAPGKPPNQSSPLSFDSGRGMARAWSEGVTARRRQSAAWAFMREAVGAYLKGTGRALGNHFGSAPVSLASPYQLDDAARALARSLGASASTMSLEDACYQLSACYTALLPEDLRGAWGAFYTPPALTARLLTLAGEANVDWATARVLDPACGGGAFLLPVAIQMRKALPHLDAPQLLEHFASHLRGFEIDPFAAWLTYVWLEIAFASELAETQRRFPEVVTVCDSLDVTVKGTLYDLVIGNPPYGRLSLTEEQRERYSRSLYGHANLYGVFTDLAVRWTRKGGVIAYVTPTSFLAGQYFKALRELLAKEAPLVAVDFITDRRGVFDGVLQEAMLATYRRGSQRKFATVHYLTYAPGEEAAVTQAGRFKLPPQSADPWIAPRTPEQARLVCALAEMPSRLADWGYTVSTGPLVWNRFKTQFHSSATSDTLPVIWAEAVTNDGKFVFRADRRGHQPYFKLKEKDGWLKVTQPCVLVQRTTAKEQNRRVIAAEMPSEFIARHGAVIVENHLNMVRANGTTSISPKTLALVLNSSIVDAAFRCISGSVAVSAFELEALPLPSAKNMLAIEAAVAAGKTDVEVETMLRSLYGEKDA